MPRGGARLNSGPPPDPNALRRDRPSDKAGWTMLPASGREGPTPEWPLSPDITVRAKLVVAERERDDLLAEIDAGNEKRGADRKLERLGERIATLELLIEGTEQAEKVLWAELWRTPQAVAWESLLWTREVAMYVRLSVAAEFGDLDSLKEARMWSDRLGMNPNALLRNRWKIEQVSTPAPAAETTKSGGRTRGKKKGDQSARDRFTVLEGGASGSSST